MEQPNTQQQQQQQHYGQPTQQLPPGQYQQYQQYQPFYQYPQNTGMPAVHISPRGMWSTKLSLRIFSMVSCLILIGISAALAVSWSLTPIIVFGGPVVVAFVWNFAESICLCVRRGHRGIHPGAIVGVDLLLWLGYIVCCVFQGLFGLGYEYYYDSYYYDGYGRFSLYRVVLGFGALEVIIHLILFIIGCYETHIRNRSQQVVYVQPTPGGPVMYPPPNFQMAQVYQPGFPQPPPPAQHQHQSYAPPQARTSEVPTAATSPISTTQNQQS